MRTQLWYENLNGRDYWEDNINMHLKGGLFGSGYGPVVDFCDLGNEPSGSTQWGGGRDISGQS